MIVWKLGIIANKPNPSPTDFQTRWYPRKCDAKAAEPKLQAEGYKTLMLEKVSVPIRDSRDMIVWLNRHAKN